MGVPAFFRWLSKKYPSVICHCVEEKPREGIPVDLTRPNPNGVEFDNLYLDMNGIIHPCTHPEDKPAPQSEDEMMIAIFEAIDRLMAIVRPRKLLYMAIDGVAPRAKMNQQRSRRFRASKESHEKVIEMSRIRTELEEKGYMLPPQKDKQFHFDSNCITPGTPFMWRLSKCLMYYVHDRMNKDPGWQSIKVILSDANCPGEGEHKIMDYIRRQRASPGHDPNTKHCLCGADADLIMLGLATHEPHFTIIREEFKPNKPKPCDICGQMGHEMAECKGLARPHDGTDSGAIGDEQKFIFVRLNVLREYLEQELEMPNLPFKYDLERAIDDWVFMCFFVGNDFLPHLPSLEIREGAIDRLVALYKKSVYKTGGFLTLHGVPTMSRVQLILSDLGTVEDVIFVERQQRELDFRARDKNKKKAEKRQKKMREADIKPTFVPEGQFAPQALGGGRGGGGGVAPLQNIRQEARDMRMRGMHTSSGPQRSGFGYGSQQQDQRDREESSSEEEDNEPPDEVRLYEDGFKDRYYESKFDVGKENLSFRHQVGGEYAHGLCWVLRYYYQGCPSWKWFFPFHYAPFASDFIDIGSVSTDFERDTKPFLPLEQLMGVFPAASRSHVPEPFGEVMLDPDSPIIDFYPEDFKIDLNGKKYAWQGVALLPFVEEDRLRKALKPLYPQLTQAEIQRNVRGDDRLFIHKRHPAYQFVLGLYEGQTDPDMEVTVDPAMFDRMSGTILLCGDNIAKGDTLPTMIDELEDVDNNNVATIRFRDPKFPPGFVFKAQRLEGAENPPKVLKPGDRVRGGGGGRGRGGRGRGGQQRDWYPVIGMVPHQQRGSLGTAGHRMLNFHQGGGGDRGGQYGNVPPPRGMDDRSGGRGWFMDRRGSGRGGRGSSYQHQDRWDQGRRPQWRY